jgi:3-phenylpropionate/trans-cinnamate dioxygenase ferredoxin subunit
MPEDFIRVASLADISPGQMLKVTVNDKQLLLANDNGRIFAVDEMCSHEDYSLYLGCIRDGKIKCSLHGSWFDLASGEPTAEPADEPICTYAVLVENDEILVNPACRNKPGT